MLSFVKYALPTQPQYNMEMPAGVQERRAIYGKTDQLSMHFIRNLRMCREELESSAFPLQGERSSNWSYRYKLKLQVLGDGSGEFSERPHECGNQNLRSKSFLRNHFLRPCRELNPTLRRDRAEYLPIYYKDKLEDSEPPLSSRRCLNMHKFRGQ